ncbi:MAG: helix-turn-helix domain-containing protein [Thermoanaerobaculia bacterium]
MPTLQRYKKLYQGRLPSVGKGRKQRYTGDALAVFEQIKTENIGKRGRPKKSASGSAAAKPPKKRQAAKAAPKAAKAVSKSTRPAAKVAAKVAAKPARAAKAVAKPTKAAAKTATRRGSRKDKPQTMVGKAAVKLATGLLTLTQISEKTGISYPTLVRYVKMHGRSLPHEGKGRRRRFHPEAIDIFKRLRSESPRGGRKAAAKAAPKTRSAKAAPARGAKASSEASARVVSLEKAVRNLEKKLESLVSRLSKSLRVR